MMQRVRIRFAKQGDLVFISHLDLARLIDRAARRGKLPLAMTKGFNPHPKISFPLALALGMESRDEVVEMDLEGGLSVAEVEECLSTQLPRGIRINKVELIAPNHTGIAREVAYRVILPKGEKVSGEAARALLNCDEVLIERKRGEKTRVFDARPFILDLKVGRGGISIRLKFTESGSVRPEELLRAMGVSEDVAGRSRMIRTKVVVE